MQDLQDNGRQRTCECHTVEVTLSAALVQDNHNETMTEEVYSFKCGSSPGGGTAFAVHTVDINRETIFMKSNIGFEKFETK